jgi:hypothetical protein
MEETGIGNCWTYALKNWFKYGGYIAVRKAPDVKILNFIPIYHVIWVLDLKDAELRQFVPIKRKHNKWAPFFAIIFKGKVITTESDRFKAKIDK